MNRKTNKIIRSLYGYQLDEIFKKFDMRGYSKLLVPQKKKKIIEELDEGQLLEILLDLDIIAEKEVEWKRTLFTKKMIWKKKRKVAKIKLSKSSVNLNHSPIFYLLLLLFLSSFIVYFKPNITYALFDYSVCEKLSKRDQTRIVELAIDLNNQIYKSKHYKTDLKKLLTEEVLWFKPPRRSKHKIRFGTRLYDEFCFCGKPEKTINPDSFIDGSYNFTVLGAYRFKNPKDTLYKVQRLYVEIKDDLIMSIKSLDEEEAILETTNWFYRRFWLVPFFLAVVSYIFIFAISDDMKKYMISSIRELIK